MEQIKALSLNPKVPDGLMRSALKVQCNDDGYVGSDLDKDDNDASPPKCALRSCSPRDEYAAPFDKDGDLEEWQDERVEDAKYENVLQSISNYFSNVKSGLENSRKSWG